jgi:hypothetical protein
VALPLAANVTGSGNEVKDESISIREKALPEMQNRQAARARLRHLREP